MPARSIPQVLTTPQRLALLSRLLKFGAVGVVGFFWDTVSVYALAPWLGLYGAGIAAYLVASSTTWVMNRLWTFRDRDHGQAHRQWALSITAGAGGFMLNRGTFIALVATSPLCRTYPVLGVAAGSIAGMAVNFTMATRVVFRG